MKYSYIRPRKKSPVTNEMKFVFVFFGISFFMLFSTYGYLFFKDYTFNRDIQEIEQKRQNIKKHLADMKSDIKFIKKQSLLAKRIYTQNDVLKDSITNLFDLIPSKITLTQAEILRNGLIFHGITPNKDIYNFMLQAPLSSIFSKTYTSFYPLDNGWLSFVSKNYTDENEPTDAIDDEINKQTVVSKWIWEYLGKIYML